MDKIKVNNQVVSMRKFVKQAKIRSINRCTKQIKFLENRKGSEEQMAKAKRKLDRLLEEVNILKKIKPDSVSKLALSKAKDWKAVLAEKNVPLEERCFAMLANHPPVQDSVEKFHSDNSELITKIPELVKEWEEKKSRSSQINKKKHKGNQNDARDPNKLPIGNKNNFHKSNENLIKHQSSESLGSLPNNSGLKSVQSDVTEQDLKFKKATKRKVPSDSMSDNLVSSSIPNSPPKKKLLIVDNEKSNEFDDSLSGDSDIANHEASESEEELSIKDKKSYQANENDSDGSSDSMSDNSDPSNILSIASKKKLVADDGKSNESDDSLSDGLDIATDQCSQSKEKLPVNDVTKKDLFRKNSKQSKACTGNHQINLVDKKTLLKKKTVNSGNSKEFKVESSIEENSGKLQDIRSKLLEISMSKSKVQSKQRNKPSPVLHQLNAGVETDSDDEGSAGTGKKLDNSTNVSSIKSKPEVKSKIKAITMLNLNELQDVDEIPIDKSDTDAEEETDEDSGKPKKDPFFLHDGEPVSESDEEETAGKGTAKKQDFPSFKKKPYGNFNKREQRDDSFQKRRFNNREQRDDSYQKKKFNNRELRDDSFQKRKFDKHSVNGRNSNFREKGFVKNKELSFKDKKQNFKQTLEDNSELRQNKKFQFASKDKFSYRNGTNNFAKNPKEKSLSQNNNRDVKRNSYPPKPNLSNSTPISKPDDKPLHPSWEAKRKLKEAASIKFQGKRMVFND